MQPTRLVTLEAAADHAGVSLRTIYRWKADGLITAYRSELGRNKVRVDLDEIDARIEPTVMKAG